MRISWIDNLKGIGILLIVLGHCYFPEKSVLITYIFSFHIALFFFLSGVLFHDKKYTKPLGFILQKANRLLIPYIWFNIIMFFALKGKDIFTHIDTIGISISSFIKGLLYGSYLIIPDHGVYLIIPDNSNLTNIPTWFLMALFMCSIFYFFLNTYIKNRMYKIMILFMIALGIFIESKYMYFRFPWSSEIALMSMFFYGIGHTFQQEIIHFTNQINKKYLVFIPFFILLNIIGLSTPNINFSSNFYGNNFLFFLLNSFLGILTYIIIAKNIPKNKLLDFFGQNSIIILGFEGIKGILLDFIIKISNGFLTFEKSYINGYIEFFITLGFLSIIIIIINKFFPFILGIEIKK